MSSVKYKKRGEGQLGEHGKWWKIAGVLFDKWLEVAGTGLRRSNAVVPRHGPFLLLGRAFLAVIDSILYIQVIHQSEIMNPFRRLVI